jgi:xanthine/uracil permease
MSEARVEGNGTHPVDEVLPPGRMAAIVFESGITAASVAAVLLNIAFNVIGGRSEPSADTTAHIPTAEEV